MIEKCTRCGFENIEGSLFCQKCGTQLITKDVSLRQKIQKVADKPPVSNTKVSDEDKSKLQKIYKNTGDSSIAISIVGFLAFIAVNLSTESLNGIAVFLLILISFLIYIPFFHYGRILKSLGTNNLPGSFKVAKAMLIYTIILTAILFMIGFYFGFLWFLLIYYYYKSTKKPKSYLVNNTTEYMWW